MKEVEASREDERSRSKRIARNEEVMRFNEMARLQNLAVKGFFKRQEEHLEERTTPDDYDEKKPNAALSEVNLCASHWLSCDLVRYSNSVDSPFSPRFFVSTIFANSPSSRF